MTNEQKNDNLRLFCRFWAIVAIEAPITYVMTQMSPEWNLIQNIIIITFYTMGILFLMVI